MSEPPVTGRAPAPSEVEALLVATLVERAEDVVWDPSAVALPPGGLPGTGPVRRLVRARRRLLVPLAAAACVVAVLAGVRFTGGPGLRTQEAVVPAVPQSGPGPTGECARVNQTRVDPTLDPTYQPLPDLTLEPDLVDPTPQPGPTPSSMPTGSPALSDLVEDLSRMLDPDRYALMSIGNGFVVVHVVDGPQAAEATRRVMTCRRSGVRLEAQLVRYSQARLEAVQRDLAAAPPIGLDGSGTWIDTDTNRVLVAVGTQPPQEVLDGLRSAYGDMLAVQTMDGTVLGMDGTVTMAPDEPTGGASPPPTAS